MTYQLWDKISPIYDITAEQAMINNPLYSSENSYLILRDDGSILDILPISTLRELTGKDTTASDEEVCEAYIAKLNEPPPAPPSGGDVSELAAKVANLEEQFATIEAVNKAILGVE